MKNYTLKVGEVFTDQKRKELQEYLEFKDEEIEQLKIDKKLYTITKAPATKLEIDMFRRKDVIYLNIEKEQYAISLKSILKLEDLNSRTNLTNHKLKQ